MPSNPREYSYWDSGVILDYLQANPERIHILDVLIDNITNGKYPPIITSTLAQTEVAFFDEEGFNHKPNLAIENVINIFWANSKLVKLVEVNSAITLLARSLIRQSLALNQPNIRVLKSADAIHLASAQWLLKEGVIVQEFFTYDDKMLKSANALYKVGILSFEAHEPYTNLS
jgi:hypothetical protein